MKKTAFITLCTLACGGYCIPALALNALETRQLLALDPQTRIEQRCDIEAMDRINKETKWRTDKVLAYAYSDPIISGKRIQANGAAFRARGNWYHLSYDCRTEEDRIKVISFTYKTGSLIPHAEWDRHYLVP
ncbi:DUF930 domain-containing protein [Bartonella sp. DGB2]|uniref:DUF930 domain-containing protein n=1 Tax=Bartonella sp. DGB2 TaxID=3388426 RepID=UPI00398FBE24